MAINELLDPISRVVSTEIYINDKQIDKNAVADYIENIEIEVNYFRHSIIGVFTCFEIEKQGGEECSMILSI